MAALSWHERRRENSVAWCSATAHAVSQSSAKKETEATLGCSLGFCSDQPAREFIFEFAGEIHTKFRAGFDTQGVAVASIEEKTNWLPTRRTRQDLANFI